MASQYPPGSYDETTLLALDQAFRDICTVLNAHDPLRDCERDVELRTVLAEKLLALVAAGVRDPDELRRRALETLPLQLGGRMAS